MAWLRTPRGRNAALIALAVIIITPARWIGPGKPAAAAPPPPAAVSPPSAAPPVIDQTTPLMPPLLRSGRDAPGGASSTSGSGTPPGGPGDMEGGSTAGIPVVAYTVRLGDTLSGIAARFHTDLASVEASNGLDDQSVLQPGQKLQVPTQVGWVYGVIGGDTLGAIAARAGVSVDRLAAANHISPNSVLQIGQRLWVPRDPPARALLGPGRSSSGGSGTSGPGATGGSSSGSSSHGLALRWPVHGPITSPFGWRYLFGRRDFHEGIDIGVPYGTPVHAAVSGRVVGAGWDGPYGIAVRIQSGHVLTLYAHNERLAVHVGEQVGAGQLISYAGATGNATGPHVHFGVYIDGVAVNPMRYLP